MSSELIYKSFDVEDVMAMFSEDLVTAIRDVASEYYDLVMHGDEMVSDARACFNVLLMLVHEQGEREC